MLVELKGAGFQPICKNPFPALEVKEDFLRSLAYDFKHLSKLELVNLKISPPDLSSFLCKIGVRLKGLRLREISCEGSEGGTPSSSNNNPTSVDRIFKEAFGTFQKLMDLEITRSLALDGSVLRWVPEGAQLIRLAIGIPRLDWDHVAGLIQRNGKNLKEIKLENCEQAKNAKSVLCSLKSTAGSLEKLTICGKYWDGVREDAEIAGAFACLRSLKEFRLDPEDNNPWKWEPACCAIISNSRELTEFHFPSSPILWLDRHGISDSVRELNVDSLSLGGQFRGQTRESCEKCAETIRKLENLQNLKVSMFADRILKIPDYSARTELGDVSLKSMKSVADLEVTLDLGSWWLPSLGEEKDEQILRNMKAQASRTVLTNYLLPQSIRALTLVCPQKQSRKDMLSIVKEFGKRLTRLSITIGVRRSKNDSLTDLDLSQVHKSCPNLRDFQFIVKRTKPYYGLFLADGLQMEEDRVSTLKCQVGMVLEKCKKLERVVVNEFLRRGMEWDTKRGIKVTSEVY